MNPNFSIEFFNVAVVPALLKAPDQLEADGTEIVNQTLEGIFGSEVTLKTIRFYINADLQNKFRAEHSAVIEAVKKRTYQQGPSVRSLVEDSLSFSPRKSYIRSSTTTFITQNDKVKKPTEEDYEFGRIVDERELSPKADLYNHPPFRRNGGN